MDIVSEVSQVEKAMRFRTVIIQRSKAESSYLRHLLSSKKDFQVVAHSEHSDHLQGFVESMNPDVLLLDVHLFHDKEKLLVPWGQHEVSRPAVVFTASDSRFARHAFELSAADYLVKPVDRVDLFVAFERVRQYLLKGRNEDNRRRNHRGETLCNKEVAVQRRLLVRTTGRTHVVRQDQIDRVESDRNYTMIHTIRGVLRLRASLGSVEEQLDSCQFVKVHRCHIVNVDRIVAIDAAGPQQGQVLHLTNGSQVAIAKSRVRYLNKVLRFS